MRIELTVTAKGQVTLRQAVLDHLGIGPGDRVSVALRPDGRAELLPLRARPEIKSVRGILKRTGQRPVTIEEMQQAIEEGAEGQDR